MGVDYKEIGLKVGLECHQQLDTKHKLFCGCRPVLRRDDPDFTFTRRLRPTQSELGQVDPAALFEFRKGKAIVYEGCRDTTCLVEADEEPPHDLDREALETALTVALMLEAQPVDETHVMRKMVIDGSTPFGFQRTAVVASNGKIEVEGKEIPIQTICLEEDACRKIREEGVTVYYRLDRLGIPLAEVVTAPVLHSPQEAEKTALTIGRILRATGRVKRGLGTIRQDINISIREGALTEIKGVQELELVSRVVEYEVQRQLSLLKIRDELKRRGIVAEDIRDEFVDATHVFRRTKCRVIRRALEQNQRVLAVKLPKFAGLLKRELMPGMGLGREMADIAHFWGRVGGIFHTDELPAYGITAEETDQLKIHLKAEPQDAVVFVADTQENASDALKAAARRAREAVEGVPEETRAANPDGTTRYMRPRPGAARMYPETDVPPIQVTEELLGKLRAHLPEPPGEKMGRLMREYGLNPKLTRQVLDSDYADLFEATARETGVSPTVIAVALTETLKALKREGVEIEEVTDQQIRELFRLLDAGEAAKEAIPDIVTWLSKHEEATAGEAVQSLGLAMIPEKELERMIDDIIGENRGLIERVGRGAYGPLMGMVMKRVRGRAKAGLVDDILRRKLEEATQ